MIRNRALTARSDATAVRRLWLFGLCALCALVLEGGQAAAETLYTDPADQRLLRWRQLIDDGQGATERAQLEVVNDFFNGARFVEDRDLWRVADYWATPDEFLRRDAGDCEDFAIAKYFTLKAMGMASDKLRITYVKVASLQQAHMVLAYYPSPSAEPLILDNLNRRIHPASERSDLRPIYSFNAETLWLARSRHEQLPAGHPGQLQRWREMVARLDPQLRKAIMPALAP